MKEQSVWTDKRVEDIMGNLLILGVIIAAALAIFGGVVFLIRHGLEKPDYGVFHGEPSDLRSIEGVISQTLNFRGRGIIQLGLMMLILTPIARVAFSVFAFYKENDRLYVAVNLIVLCFLLFSLFGGIAIK